MDGRDLTTVLDLSTLPDQCRLVGDTARSLATAASVTLERMHGPREHDVAVLRSRSSSGA